MDGKMASQKLKVINDKIETAKDQGLPVEHLEEWVIPVVSVVITLWSCKVVDFRQRAELEKEVIKSAKLMEKDHVVEETQEGSIHDCGTSPILEPQIDDSYTWRRVKLTSEFRFCVNPRVSARERFHQLIWLKQLILITHDYIP